MMSSSTVFGQSTSISARLTAVRNGLFQALSLMAKRQQSPAVTIIAGDIIKWLQMMSFLFQSTDFAWDQRVLEPLRISTIIFSPGTWFHVTVDPAAVQSTFFLAFAWVTFFCGMLLWAVRSFVQGRIPALPPLRILAAVGQFSASVAYIPLLTTLLSVYTCGAGGSEGSSKRDPWEGFSCYTGAHLALVCLASIFAVVFTALAALFVLVFFDNHPLCSDLGARVHGRAETIMLFVNLALVLGMQTFPLQNKWAIVGINLGASFVWAASKLYYMPYITFSMNSLHVALACGYLWGTICLIIVAAAPQVQAATILYVGLPLAFIAGYSMTHWRRQYVLTRAGYRLNTVYEVEMKARFLMQHALHDLLTRTGGDGQASSASGMQVEREDVPYLSSKTAAGTGGQVRSESWRNQSTPGVYSQHTSSKGDGAAGKSIAAHPQENDFALFGVSYKAMDAESRERIVRDRLPVRVLDEVEQMFKDAAMRFPTSAILHMYQSQFYQVFRGRNALATSHLLLTNRLGPSLDVAYMAFQARRALDAGSTAGGALRSAMHRLAFDKHLLDAKSCTLKAARAQVAFWAELADSAPDVNRLHRVATDLARYTAMAENDFKTVFQLQSQSLAAMRLFAQFNVAVANNPDKAAAISAEAERIEDQKNKEQNAQKAGGFASQGFPFLEEVPTDLMTDATATMTVGASNRDLGIILSASAAVSKLLGYTRSQLERRNVSIIVPPPFGEEHDAYLRRYISTGEGLLMESTHQFLGRHRHGFLVPFTMILREMLLADNTPVFHASLKPLNFPDHVVMMDADWKLLGGTAGALMLLQIEPNTLSASEVCLADFCSMLRDEPSVADLLAKPGGDVSQMLLPGYSRPGSVDGSSPSLSTSSDSSAWRAQVVDVKVTLSSMVVKGRAVRIMTFRVLTENEKMHRATIMASRQDGLQKKREVDRRRSLQSAGTGPDNPPPTKSAVRFEELQQEQEEMNEAHGDNIYADFADADIPAADTRRALAFPPAEVSGPNSASRNNSSKGEAAAGSSSDAAQTGGTLPPHAISASTFTDASGMCPVVGRVRSPAVDLSSKAAAVTKRDVRTDSEDSVRSVDAENSSDIDAADEPAIEASKVTVDLLTGLKSSGTGQKWDTHPRTGRSEISTKDGPKASQSPRQDSKDAEQISVAGGTPRPRPLAPEPPVDTGSVSSSKRLGRSTLVKLRRILADGKRSTPRQLRKAIPGLSALYLTGWTLCLLIVALGVITGTLLDFNFAAYERNLRFAQIASRASQLQVQAQYQLTIRLNLKKGYIPYSATLDEEICNRLLGFADLQANLLRDMHQLVKGTPREDFFTEPRLVYASFRGIDPEPISLFTFAMVRDMLLGTQFWPRTMSTGDIIIGRRLVTSLNSFSSLWAGQLKAFANTPLANLTDDDYSVIFLTTNSQAGAPALEYIRSAVYESYLSTQDSQQSVSELVLWIFLTMGPILSLILCTILCPILMYINASKDDVAEAFLDVPALAVVYLRNAAAKRMRALRMGDEDEEDTDEEDETDAARLQMGAIDGSAVDFEVDEWGVEFWEAVLARAAQDERKANRGQVPPAATPCCCRSSSTSPKRMYTSGMCSKGKRAAGGGYYRSIRLVDGSITTFVRRDFRKNSCAVFKLGIFLLPIAIMFSFFLILYLVTLRTAQEINALTSFSTLSSIRQSCVRTTRVNLYYMVSSPAYPPSLAFRFEWTTMQIATLNMANSLLAFDFMPHPDALDAQITPALKYSKAPGSELTSVPGISETTMHTIRYAHAEDACTLLSSSRFVARPFDMRACEEYDKGSLSSGLQAALESFVSRARRVRDRRYRAIVPVVTKTGTGVLVTTATPEWAQYYNDREIATFTDGVDFIAEGGTYTGNVAPGSSGSPSSPGQTEVRTGLNVSRIISITNYSVPEELAGEDWNTLTDMATFYLIPAFQELSDIYQTAALASVAQYRTFVPIFLGTCIGVYVLGVVLLYMPAVSRLGQAVQTTQAMLLLLPPEVLTKMPSLWRLVLQIVSAFDDAAVVSKSGGTASHGARVHGGDTASVAGSSTSVA